MTQEIIKRSLKETKKEFYRIIDFKTFIVKTNLYISINNKWLKRHNHYRFVETMTMNIDNNPIGFNTYFPNPKAINITYLFEGFNYNDLIQLISHYLCFQILIDGLKNNPFGILIDNNIIDIINKFFELYNKLEKYINKKENGKNEL